MKKIRFFVKGINAAFLSFNVYNGSNLKILDLGSEEDSQKIYSDWQKIGNDMGKYLTNHDKLGINKNTICRIT